MWRRYWVIVIPFFLLLLLLGIWFLEKSNQLGIHTNDIKRSIFSWSSEEITDNREQFVGDLMTYDFNRVFQSFSSKLSNEEIIPFLAAVTEQDIDVYSLAGTPEWALDPTGSSMIKQLDWIVEMNSQLPKRQHIKGLVIDVEPYTLDEFDWADKDVRKTFISGVSKLYQASEKENLELIVVIPYFYDTKGYEEVAKTFIQEYSDEVAVMNYYRDREIENLTFEAREANKVDKPLTTIYELKRPGEHGLYDKNTYFNVGWSAVLENMDQLSRYYEGQTIHIAIHDYRAFREVIQYE